MEYYTIREMTRRFSLPASTLRYYEQEGLLPPVGRTPEGQRIYDARHAGRLETIACFKGTGMTIAQLRQLFRYEQDGDACIGEILALLRDQRDPMCGRKSRRCRKPSPMWSGRSAATRLAGRNWSGDTEPYACCRRASHKCSAARIPSAAAERMPPA